MGVHGLSTFIRNNPSLFIDEHMLRDTHLIIDAFNLMNNIAEASQHGERPDIFGGDMVKFGSELNKFFDNLAACNIVPILVMDGAQTYEQNTSKVPKKHQRYRERFKNVMRINEQGIGRFVLPTTANITFKSVAVDRGVKIYQSIFEADSEIARLARYHNCPVLSEDSDFYVFDLPQGVIPISDFKWHKVRTNTEDPLNWRESNSQKLRHNYISCRLYKQEHLKIYLPNFNLSCMPIIGPLLGNDFVKIETYSGICKILPSKLPFEFPNPYMSKQLRVSSTQHHKIVKLLCFCCDKDISQVINQLSSSLPNGERSDFKKKLKDSMDVYNAPLEDTYEMELKKIYEEGYKATYAKRIPESDLDVECKKTIRSLALWLIKCSETSVMTHKVLELLNKNIIFDRPQMDDTSLPSSLNLRSRVYAVILRILRPTTVSKKPIEVHSRIGSDYERTLLQQLHELNHFGRIRYLAYDIPKLSPVERRDLVLATFHYNHERYLEGLMYCDTWFDPKHSDEVMNVLMLMDYIDIESPCAKLWKYFRQATLLSMVYHLCGLQEDTNFSCRLEQENKTEFIQSLVHIFESNRGSLQRTPLLGPKRPYDCRIMHQITQLNVSVDAFGILNALLGDPLSRIRPENWLNSCLLYNLTDLLRTRSIKVPDMPDIIAQGKVTLIS